MPAAATAKSQKNRTSKTAQTAATKKAAGSTPAQLAQKPNKPSPKQAQQAKVLSLPAEQKSAITNSSIKFPPASNNLPSTRSTKQEIVLNLLSDPKGASIDEIMAATSWQKHSVRGFLAGTVKGKLGFTLTSSKVEGAERRYRIEQKKRR